MRHCAFLTMDNLDDFFTYDELLLDPMKQLGWEVDFVSWRDKKAKWDKYEAVVIRSPWDYQDDPEAFMDVLEHIDASSARLENKLETVRWNIDKTYLREMQQKGIDIVPTLWFESWDQLPGIPALFDELEVNEIIIKPTVSANADDTFRINEGNENRLSARLADLFSPRPFMVQPFLNSIIDEGEYSLFYFGEEYSHAIIKRPGKGDFRVQEEHGGTLHEHIPDKALKDVGDRTMQNISPLPLYSRIDFARMPDGSYALMELELIEPSLYFNMDDESPQLFAGVFDAWMS